MSALCAIRGVRVSHNGNEARGEPQCVGGESHTLTLTLSHKRERDTAGAIA